LDDTPQKVKTYLPYLIALTFAAQVARAQTTVKTFVFPAGTVNASSASYKLNAMVGEDAIGQSSSASYSLRAGFLLSPADRLPDLQILNATIFPTSVRPGETTAVTFSVKNIGDVVAAGAITVKAYLSTNAVLDGTDVELATLDCGTDLGVNQSVAFPVGAQDNKVTIPLATAIQSYQVILVVDPLNVVAEKNETNNVNTNALLLDVTTSGGGGDDIIAPVFGTATRPSFVDAGGKIEIPVTDNASGVQSVKFYHKSITSKDDFVEEETTAAAGNYSVLIQASWSDDVGIECYFKAKDVAENEASSPVILLYNPVPANQSVPTLSFGGGIGDYRIFSIPYQLDDNSISEVFKDLGEYDKTKWRIVRYQGGRNVDRNAGLTKIERGQGFWFNSVEKTDVRIGSGTTVDKSQSPDFTMSFEKGYNQVGDPFIFDINWADVLAANPTVASKLSQQVLVFNSANVSLEASDNLKAWSGGFVLADDALTISVPASLGNGSARVARTVIDNLNPDLDQWIMPIQIQQGGVVNTLGGIGMHPEANVSKDIYDIITPPKFVQYVGMSSQHTDFFQPDFSRDVVNTMSSYNWKFQLESDINTTNAEIMWNNEGLKNSLAELLLYDVSQRTLVDMKQSDHYTIDPQRSHEFRFFYGSDRSSVKPDIQEIGIAWPNPVSDVVHVPYLVKEQSHIQVEVFDLMGRKVNNIVNSVQQPGYHVATWNRTSFDGSTVAPGVYIYRLNGSATIGRLIVN